MLELGGVGLGVAFLAGLLSCLSPCVLPLVPAYLGYLSGAATATARTQASGPGAAVAVQARPTVAGPSLLHALGFVGGFTVVFVLFGVSLGLLGFFLREHLSLVQKVAGSLLILLGLHLAGVITIPWLERERRLGLERGTGYGRSFLVGASFAAGWSPCIGPTLGAILALAVSGGTVAQAAALLLAYSAGMAVPFLVMGAAFDALRPAYERLRQWAWAVNYVSGTVLVVMGVLVFTNSLVGLNRLFDWGPLSELSGRF